jgi:hypothetical protein
MLQRQGYYIPTAEWIDPYAGLTDDEKDALTAEFESPPPVTLGPVGTTS